MSAYSFDFSSSVRAKISTRMNAISTGDVKTGKEVVRESYLQFENQREIRHSRVLSQFVESEGKGVKVDISI